MLIEYMRERVVSLLLFYTALVTSVAGFVVVTSRIQPPCCHSPTARYRIPCSILSSAVEGIEVVPQNVLDHETCEKIEEWIQKRAKARWAGDYKSADAFREQLYHSDLLPDGLSLQIEDIPRSAGGGSRWSLICDISKHLVVDVPNGPTVLQLAHSALGLAVDCAQTHQNCSLEQELLVDQAMQRLQGWATIQDIIQRQGISFFECVESNPGDATFWWAVEQELRGRKAADAAFWFAMAGVSKQKVYDLLLQVGVKEIQRFGHRPSCRVKDIWAVVDRFAAAGVRPTGNAIRAVSTLLTTKNDHEVSVDEVMSRWDLHSDSCALLVWKFSTRQRKQRDFLVTAARHWQSQQTSLTAVNHKIVQPTYNWTSIFRDPERPLVIDCGCGMGVSLLGVASMASSDEEWHPWERCNFLGIDLSPLAIGYAQGVSQRWGLDHSLHFLVDSAERAMEMVKSTYPGNVSQIMIQFPTPFRLVPSRSSNDEYQGNRQLPKDAEDGFMVSKNLLKIAASLLRGSGGTLLLQSNCEDVAVHMWTVAEDVGMAGVPSKDPRLEMPSQSTQRTETWLSQQKYPPDRAAGSSWWDSPVLPQICQTETEIACGLNGTPVHRCLLHAPTNADPL